MNFRNTPVLQWPWMAFYLVARTALVGRERLEIQRGIRRANSNTIIKSAMIQASSNFQIMRISR